MIGASAALFICSKLEAKPPTLRERIWSRLRIYTLLNTSFSHPRKPRWVQEEKKHSSLMCKKKKNRPLLVQINMDSTCHVQKKHYSPWLCSCDGSQTRFWPPIYTKAETERLDSDQVDGARQARAIYIMLQASCLISRQLTWYAIHVLWIVDLCLWSNMPVF